MKVAIVHDYLTTLGGAEKILEQLLLLYPDSTLFSLMDFLPQKKRAPLLGKKVTTTFMQKLPLAKRYYRNYLPLMPIAIEQLDLSGFDLLLSISFAVAKGVIVAPGQTHICICCSPMRYLWDLSPQYLKGRKRPLARYLLHRMRTWDVISANRVDHYIAISKFTKERMQKNYRRDAKVIYPPVSVANLPFSTKKEEFYLTASRLVFYKRIDLIVEAFREMPEKKLVVIGEGPEYRRLVKKKPPNVEFLGYQSDSVLQSYLKRAKAFIFAAEEDFGILPVEAMACGTPVIAYGRGGACETVVGLEEENPTGLFFAEQTPLSLKEACVTFEGMVKRITPKACRARAEKFSQERFCREIKSFIEQKYESSNPSRR